MKRRGEDSFSHALDCAFIVVLGKDRIQQFSDTITFGHVLTHTLIMHGESASSPDRSCSHASTRSTAIPSHSLFLTTRRASGTMTSALERYLAMLWLLPTASILRPVRCMT